MSFEDPPAPPNSSDAVPFDVIYVGAPGAVQPLEPEPPKAQPRRRRTILPLVLFILTCGSMYLVGGLTYMLAGMAVLVAHEMGHFLQAVRYGVPASLPYFIPLPIPPLGTMGALISMRGSVANRKQMFDIGLTGPIAGLLVALPICWIGVRDGVPAGVSVEQARRQGDVFNDPLAVQLMIRYLRPELPPDTVFNMNPYYMAGWMAMLITGLNMVPVSQLDGGHVAYALLGRKAHWLARGVIVVALAYMLVSRTFFFSLMLLLVVFVIGIDHPPTADDSVPIGFWRKVIGVASLAIPVFCLAPMPILFRTG